MNKEVLSYIHQNQEKKETQELNLLHFEEREISLGGINVLPQPRKTFLFIPELAESIRLNGLLTPLLIAEFDPENCQRHIEVMNLNRKEKIEFSSLKKSWNDENKEKYYVLIGGERRIRAIKLLGEQGVNLQEIFTDHQIPARICENPSPLIFIRLQLAENIHTRPLAHEEANYIDGVFQTMKLYQKDYTLTTLSKDIGKSYKTVKKATQFCRLPSFIQNAVKDNFLSYGSACEISEMEVYGFSEKEMNIMAKNAIIGKWQIRKCSEEINKKIKDKESGQQPLEILTETDRQRMEKLFQKNKFAKELLKNSWEFIRLFRTHHFLLGKKQLQIKDSPYQEEELLKIAEKLYEATEESLSDFKKITQEKKKRFERISRKMKKYIKQAIVYEEKIKEKELNQSSLDN